MSRALTAVLLSLLIHFLIVWLIENWPAPPPTPKVVELDVLDHRPPSTTRNQMNKPMVTQTIVPDQNLTKENKDEAKFLSERAQRVKEEMRAQQSGLTENKGARSQNDKVNKPNPSAKSFKDFVPEPDKSFAQAYKGSQSDAEVSDKKLNRNQDQASAQNSEVPGLSAIAETVDAKIGSMTALNTDQYLFYSFFNRVNQLVYLRWTHLIEASEDRVAARLKGRTSNERWTTEIEVWVKPNGEFDSAHIMRESSVPEFDQAAAKAFRDAGLFPNPPRELIEDDGFIHLKYDLTVYMDVQNYLRR